MRYKALIFDFDGTIMDTSSIGDGYYELIRNCKRGDAEYKRIWAEIDAKMRVLPLYDGMSNVFDYLRKNNIPSVLVTGAVKRRYEIAIKKYKIPVNGYVGRFDSRKRKPNPEPIQKGIEILGCSKEDVLSVGNQIIDADASHAAGVKFAACAWGVIENEKEELYRKADYILESPKDLLVLITGNSDSIGVTKPDITILWLDNGRNPENYFAVKHKSITHGKTLDYYTKNIFNQYTPHFIWVKNLREFQEYILNNKLPELVSFDNDLTNDKSTPEPDGREVAKWFVQYCKETNQRLPRCYVHSANRTRTPELKNILGIQEPQETNNNDTDMGRWFFQQGKKNNSPDTDLRIDIYEQNLEIIKSGSYQTESGKKIRLSDREQLLNHTEMYDAPIEHHSETIPTKTITGTIEADCLYVSKALIDKGWNPAVLNLADEKLAGGYVYGGSRAQEEELCRRSTLMLSLFPRHSERYAELVGATFSPVPHYPMDKDFGGVYSPNVTVIRDTIQNQYALLDSPYSLSVISVAAVNSPTIDYDRLEIKMPKAIEREKNKMRTILRIGLVHGHDSIVLGAFGCGAFHTPPSHVARLFAEVFEEPEFKNKYKGLFFAVLEGKKQEHNPEGNVKPFIDVFGKMELNTIPCANAQKSAKEQKPQSITIELQEDKQRSLIENIQTLMTLRGYTQSSLARAMGKQPVVINRALKGKKPISPRFQMELAEIFGVTIEELNGNVTTPAAKKINGFIKFNGDVKEISSLKDLKTVYTDIIYQLEQRPNEVEQLLSDCRAHEERVKNTVYKWTDIDLFKIEAYNPREVYCWTFRKADEEKDSIINSLGNMCAGFPFSINKHTFQGSEQAYIAGLFSNNTNECIDIQKALIEEGNGYAAKKTIRNRNERKYGRSDWEEFNVQWMLYIVWQKCIQNKAFSTLLKKIPRNAIIIENSALQKGETATFWGCKNDEWKSAFELVSSNAEIVCSGKTTAVIQERIVKDSNAITCVGTYKGVNCMGKILTICRDCLLDKTEPKIDYDLLRSKQIYILGELMKFDK